MKFNKLGRRGSLLRVKDLTDEEKNILNREIAKDARVKQLDFCGEMDEKIYDSVQAQVFSEWGVMCPHPLQSDRRCEACGSLLFSRASDLRAVSEFWRTLKR